MKNLETKTFFLIGFLLASFLAAYFPVLKNLFSAWISSDEYSHGFLILPVCCYILWKRKNILKNILFKPSLWGLVIVFISLFLYLVAHLSETLTLAAISMVLLGSGIVVYLFGFPMFKACLFPIFLLLFMIPVPAQIYSALTIPLQLFVSKISVEAALLLDIPVCREGNIVYLPHRTLQIVNACSGLRSLISLLTICFIFAHLTLKSNLLRSFLIIAGIPVAIFVNIIRVILLILSFHYLNYDLTSGMAHTFLGFSVFLLALALIMLLKEFFENWDRYAVQE